jgi:hypothetical protein
MALFGGEVRTIPYQAPDYSGSVAAARSQAMAGAQGIAGGISQVTDYFKQQGEKKKLIKQSDIQIDAALKLFPDLAPTLQGVRDQIKDENISLNERADIAESVAGLVNMGTKKMQADAEFGLKKRQLDLEEGRGIQSALIDRAKMEAEANKLRPIIDINVPGGVMQMRENSQTGVLEPIQVAGQTPAAGITSALGDGPPMDIPTAEGIIIPANEGVISPDGTTVSYLGRQYTVDTGVLPVRVPNEQAASIDAGLSAAPTKGSIGFKPTKPEKQETQMTAEQVQNLVVQGFKINARPLADGSFMVSGADIGGQAGETFEFSPEGGFKMTRGGGAKAEAAKKAGEEAQKQEKQSTNQMFDMAAQTIEQIPNLPDNPIGAKAAEWFGKVVPGTPAGQVAEKLGSMNANIAFGVMQDMRDASPTGAAAGTMTEKEWPLFWQKYGNLSAATNKNDLRNRLQNMTIKMFDAANGTPDERKKAIKDKKITQEQNAKVEEDYLRLRNRMKIPESGIPGFSDTQLNVTSGASSLFPADVQSIIDKYTPQPK